MGLQDPKLGHTPKVPKITPNLFDLAEILHLEQLLDHEFENKVYFRIFCHFDPPKMAKKVINFD